MFKMSLKYIYNLYLCTTCFSHTGPSLSNIFFKESTTLCTSVVHKHRMYIYINDILNILTQTSYNIKIKNNNGRSNCDLLKVTRYG
jgi:hypothetical protein